MTKSMLKILAEEKISDHARKSLPRQSKTEYKYINESDKERVKQTKSKRIYKGKRGSATYFLFVVERYKDLNIFVMKGYVYPIDTDIKEEGFCLKHLVKGDTNLYRVWEYVKKLREEKGKKITFSKNSINLEEMFIC